MTIKREDTIKISVLNGSRHFDRVVDGEWITMTVDSSAGLPGGIYRLSDAKKAATSLHNYIGPVPQTDKASVYQITGSGVMRHDRSHSDVAPAAGQNIEIHYRYGQATIKGQRAATNKQAVSR